MKNSDDHSRQDTASAFVGDDGEEQEHGANLQLAQRHRKIVAGNFKGRKVLEPEFATPGVVGQLALSFICTGALAKESRITCQLPDHGWVMSVGSPLNVDLQLPSPSEPATTSALPQLKAVWTPATRTLEFTLLNEIVIPADTPLVLRVSGVHTPETATPQGEAIVTVFEKLVVRSTVPVSTRGGQIIDGPTAFTIPKIVPGLLVGAKRWRPFSCCPGAVSDVSLSFIVNGRVPTGGKLLIELPPDGWDMDDHPKVLLRTSMHHNKTLTASWDRSQHALEISLGGDGTIIAMKMSVTLTIVKVKNPAKETMNAAAGSNATAVGRLTTLSASGGVVDGPSKVEVARISELRESDFEILTKVLDEEADATREDGCIPLAKVPDLLRRAGLKLSNELYESLVVPNFPSRLTSPLPIQQDENNPSDSARSSSHGEAEDAETTRGTDQISREELLNVFALVYAPAYKYGQELRLACGRNHLDLVRELISRGCNPNAGDGSGWSALHYAADYGQLAVVDLLAEMTVASTDGEGGSDGKISDQTLEIDARDAHGWTPLMCAAANGHVAVLQRLLALGANLSVASIEGRSALHWAATRGMTTTVTALLTAGADVHQVDRSGWTALHCAMLHDNSSCATALTENGASLSVKDKLQYAPVFYGDACFAVAVGSGD
ncbi:hypothetical protein BBJ28_00013350 [Nothophytophthora sp. Chile5]|nr:hypothetical protein BBJ28_00020649 [Nothophytophthora sp. Chile5]RLN93147.1 hypothetical protein BBJ28_00013350 [Nothophytophthora sp. Chile5]